MADNFQAMAPYPTTVPFVPVILGAELAAYTLARAFHADLGVRASVVSRTVPYAVRGSAVLDHVACPGMDDDETLLAALRGIADAHPGRRVLVLGIIDSWCTTLSRLAPRLDERFAVPYPDVDLMERLSDKEQFARLCGELGVAHPRTSFVPDTAGDEEAVHLLGDLRWPVVVKAADSVSFGTLLYAGKQKVAYCDSPAELATLRQQLAAAGYAGGLVVQERIPGGDDQMRVLTTYSDASGRVRWGRMGQVLLEDHDPMLIGNPLAVVHGEHPVATEQVRALLEHVGWTGYANFDVKVDPRDDTGHVFELNPRLGRSHAYMSAAGHPFLVPMVREHVEGRDPLDDVEMGEETDDWLYSIVPVPLLMRYVTDDRVRTRLRRIRREGRVLRPLRYAADPGRERRLAQLKNDVHYVRDFATHHRSPVTG